MSFMPPYLSLQPRDQLTRSEPEPERRLGFGFNFNPWNKRFLKNDRKELNVSFLCLLRTIKAPFHIIFSTLSTLYTLKVMWTNDWESTPALKSQFCNNNSTFTWHYEALRNINTLVINEERLLLQISALSLHLNFINQTNLYLHDTTIPITSPQWALQSYVHTPLIQVGRNFININTSCE